MFRRSNRLTHFRLGITLKARGTAVQRNRVRRIIRESFRVFGENLGSFDYNVVIPKERVMRHPFPERLKASLEKALTEVIKAIKNDEDDGIWKPIRKL